MKKEFKIPLLIFVVVCMATASSCKKDPEIPTLVNYDVSSVTSTSAMLRASVTSDGGSMVTRRGFCWSTDHNPGTSDSTTFEGSGIGNFLSTLTGLRGNTTYYARAFAINKVGAGYGDEISFTTNDVALATVVTSEVWFVTESSAIVGGNVLDDGGDEVTSRGVCWSPTEIFPTKGNDTTLNGAGTGVFSRTLSDLAPNTHYYIRAYATNSAGTAYGNVEEFTTDKAMSFILFNPSLTYGAVSDVEGNIYKTIQIGNQTWMAENLRTTKYNDGKELYASEGSTWGGSVDDAYYCWYEFKKALYRTTFGALYNWQTIEDGNACPTGWHVPSKPEFDTLVAYLGVNSEAAGKLKETGFLHWDSTNTGASNSSGWTGLPGGYRTPDGVFADLGKVGYFWTSTPVTYASARYVQLKAEWNDITVGTTDYHAGMSIRCVKD